MEMSEIRLDDIEVAFKRTMELLRALYGDKLSVGDDRYWVVPAHSRYDAEVQPQELTIGSLDDDIESIARVAQGDLDPYPLIMTNIASVLVQLGELRWQDIKRPQGG